MAQFFDVKRSFGGFYGSAPKENKALAVLLESGRIGDMPLGHADEIRAFYAAREGKPIWTGNSAGTQKIRQFATFIDNARAHGLSPARYNSRQIADRVGERDEALRAELELFLSDAAIKYAGDMTGYHLQGRALRGEIAPLRPPMQPREILQTITDSGSVQKFFAGLEPKSATYGRLKEALADMESKNEAAYAKYLPLDFGGAIMRPGLRHKIMPGLRARLGAVQQTQDSLLYDDALFAAVTKFQRAEGLKDDGIIGLDTLAALNRTNRDRIVQLKVNMERLRWMEGQERPAKFIVVNIPAATLWAVDDNKVSFEMEVIVGRPERATPAIVTDIEGIRFNPDWTVPPTIKKEDILPKLREDPWYLTNKGIELTYRGEDGIETLDPAAVDWERVTHADLNVLHMVQVPGAGNPLGRVRVLMPNKYSIYLHDTNQKEYFDKYARALSSGCIRMQEPLKVAEFVMAGEKGWDLNKITTVIAQGRTSDRLISNKIPVYILYYTAWIDDQGRVVFGRDIYGRDKILAEALEKVDGISLAGHNKVMTNPRQKLASLGEED
ncbi:MAG: L,D-transpeptidase family protein [Alphaproteobacteria bacterium]